jgi:signal transduction histidine kinase/ActR/RegA family two-component response regulator
MAAAVEQRVKEREQRVKEREQAEQTLLNRALQQAGVAALGQLAIVLNDLSALMNHAVTIVAQMLGVEFCQIIERSPHDRTLIVRAAVGWPAEFVGKTLRPGEDPQADHTMATNEPIIVADTRTETRFNLRNLFQQHGIISGATVAIATRERTFGLLSVHTTLPRSFTGDDVHFLLAVANVLDMAGERVRADAELQRLAAFVQLNPNPAMELSADGAITYFNDGAAKLAQAIGKDHPGALLPPDIADIVQTCLATNQSRLRLETRVENRVLSWSFHPVAASQAVHCYGEDTTERLNLEAQLRQSQKMESVGQLAAGVAHDFNNMLTVIQGHAGMLLARSDLPVTSQDSAQAIYFAAERAAGLTRQLLMFSRKNVMQPRLLDLREVLVNLSKMLRRLLGEIITLQFDPPPQIPLVQADAGMMEQVIMNLCVNARDAMPQGGKLIINTVPVEVDEAYVQTHPEARAGSFVCLRVSDTGCGMDSATMGRIFEPFFTTKEAGKGTGLGLATVYGIVKQHEGWIEVASEVGQGTTFNVFLPATAQIAQAVQQRSAPAAQVVGGSETILVVEDEPVLRDMAHVILADCGYQVLEAASGVEAVAVWDRHPGAIDVLLTDMVMPDGMSGLELARKLAGAEPNLKVIFTSGYSVDEHSNDYVQSGHALFLQKPYTRVTLAKAVRDCLDDCAVAGK